MSRTAHHGRHSFAGKNLLSNASYHHQQKVGRFGRMFPHLPALYTAPKWLEALGGPKGPMRTEGDPKRTKSVPLGMIFLGQFIDHDITFDTASNFSRINEPESIENVRTPTLDLDCVFGGGPEANPYLYDDPNGRGLYLLTGKTNDNMNQGPNLEVNDLPRNGKGTALIGDPRNDENRIISQLQLAFIRFYNYVYQHIANQHPTYSAIEVYEEARILVTWHYQWIVIHEFLPQMCGQPAVDRMLGQGRHWYCPDHGQPFIPVEFSVAAYRFGHSMIAQNVSLQPGAPEKSLFDPSVGGGFSGITTLDQVVDWKGFFAFDNNYQRAEQLDGHMANILLALPFINGPEADRSLATRNLRRGQSFLLPSGESVARAMDRPEDEIRDVQNKIQNLLHGHHIHLEAGTPLWFYILAEAEEIGREEVNGKTSKGEGLGPVGATIVGEVMMGLMELDNRSFLGVNRDWRPSGIGHDAHDGKAHFTMVDLFNLAEQGKDL